MINTTIFVNEKEIKRRLGALEAKSGKVIARAANRAYPTGKKAISQEAEKEYLVKEKDVNSKKTLKVIKATQSEPTAKLKYTGYHRNLYHYGDSVDKTVDPRKIISWKGGKPNVKAYKARVKRGAIPKPLNRDPKAFVQRMKATNGIVGLFRRKSNRSNAKLVGVAGPALPQMLKNESIMEKFRRSAGEMFTKRLEHEIDAILKGVTK